MVSKAKELYCRAYQGVFKMAMPFLNWDEPYLLKGPGAVKDLPALIKSKGLLQNTARFGSTILRDNSNRDLT